ncbi:hypothetical protein [Rhodopila sp.]|uniref:hypothetical protein n=1 Tax=Rhodopila sp. TaxID=2480087 RepID=UPI003D0A0635
MTSIPTGLPMQQPVIHSAEIIAFPLRRAVQSVASPVQPEDLPAQAFRQVLPAQERLARALDALNNAMAEQRAAMTAWRSALAELKTSTSGLGQSLERYRTNLGALSQGVASLRSQTKALQNWAETAAPARKA